MNLYTIITFLAAYVRSERFNDDPDLWHAQHPNKIVQSDSEVCNNIGVKILKNNGSAADAAIAMAICIGTVLSTDSGIGGGMFLTYSNDETEEIFRINARETASINSSKDMFVNETIQTGLSIAVPGALKGYQKFHAKYGKLEWKELWRPSIELAINGFPVTEYFEGKLKK